MGGIEEYLAADGWEVGVVDSWDTCDAIWHKRFTDALPRCCGNADKPGMQLTLRKWDHRKYGAHVGYGLHLVAEPADGVWVELKAFTMTEETLLSELDRQCAKLLRMWTASCE